MTQNREPMIKLEANGKAPVISYNVPEPTSYSGRNFIDLQFPDRYFIQPQSASKASLRPSLKSDVQIAYSASVGSPEVTLEQVEQEVTQLLASANGPCSTALQNLDLNEVLAMRRAGKRLSIYRSLLGELIYEYVDAQPSDAPVIGFGSSARADAATRVDAAAKIAPAGLRATLRAPMSSESPDIIGLRPREDEPTEPPETFLEILSPAEGATIQGAHTGATVTIHGSSSAFMTRVTKVWVKVGNGPAQDATSTAGVSWATWTYTTTITQSGPVKITVGATAARGLSATQVLTLNVTLTPAPDTTAPTVVMTVPANGEVFTTSDNGAPLSVVVRGTASDDRAIQSVELQVDNEPFAIAIPVAEGNWSSWSKPVALTPGSHRLTARCSDRAGNQTTAVVAVTVNAAAPVDKLPPTVAITSPADNTTITGTFDGATLVVTGTARDATGIRHVALSVDGSPIPIPAEAIAPDWSTWRCPITINQAGTRHITAIATDLADNEARATIRVQANLVPDFVSRKTRLILVENYQLSSYLGTYGAGRTIKTFSLLPGEKTRISIKTYTRSEADAKSASSILDSVNEDSVTDFTQLMQSEQADQKNFKETKDYKVEGTASASWGWGSAKITAGASGGTNAAREEFAKNISSATQKHIAKASAKRDVQINTSYEVKTQTGEETSIERSLENINVSRTLNFVFRQMNQEFITILHLVDVRIGFYEVIEGQEPTYREVTLPQLQSLLEDVIVPEKVSEVRNDILRQLMNLFDYQDRHHAFAEEKPLVDANGKILDSYLRIKRDYVSTYADPATGTEILVPGIILAANKYVMRTEGIIVEALLGQGDGLDDYSHGLQDEAVRAKMLSNVLTEAEIEKRQLAMQIIATRDSEAAQLYEQVFGQRLLPAKPAESAPANSSTAALEETRTNGQFSHV